MWIPQQIQATVPDMIPLGLDGIIAIGPTLALILEMGNLYCFGQHRRVRPAPVCKVSRVIVCFARCAGHASAGRLPW